MVTRFLKMHGTGNDFVLIDCVENREMRSYEDSGFSSVAERICDRRFGIGADQLLLLLPSEKADFMMRIFNADGSEVEMCGNGIRCLAKYVWDKGYSDKETLEIDTPAGIITPRKSDKLVTVDMGKPIFDAQSIPVNLDGNIVDHPLKIG
ncbi:MAG: diaminopimelate epimerase, partial [Thermodesulfovibrionales bacterium]